MLSPLVPRVLLADDCPDARFIATRLLEKTQLCGEIRAVEDGSDVISILQRAKSAAQPLPDLLLLDVKMRRVGGLEVLNWLRGQAPDFARMKILMLSTSDEPRDVRRALSLGADDYVIKYPKPVVLAATLHALFRPRGSMDLRVGHGGSP